MAKTWRPETITYQGEFVCHEGATYQAQKDTAQHPGGPDWVCIARGGRDAITPNVRGTYTVNENYKTLDIVAMDGASFIAKCDNPAVLPRMISSKIDEHYNLVVLKSGARGNLIKILWHDGAAQLSYMLDGIDWRNPVYTFRPERAG